MPRSTFRPALENLEGRLLCSVGRVGQTSRFPYSAIAQVDAFFDRNHNGLIDGGDTEALATAVMIGPDTALTSGHVVYDARFGGLALTVNVTPGLNRRGSPFGTFSATSWVVPELFTNPRVPYATNVGSDIAVLKFAPVTSPQGSVRLGDLTGWLGHASYPDKLLKGATIVNVGYPALSHSGLDQYRSAGPILAARQAHGVGILDFSNRKVPIEEGASGSPIFRTTPQAGPVVVGIVGAASVDDQRNMATRITGRVNDFIRIASQRPRSGGIVLPFDFTARPQSRSLVPASG